MTILLPVIALSRLTARLHRQGRGKDESFRELRIPEWLNRLFALACRLEMRMIESGCNLKFGGSLICTGVKR
jgi:hypothetical protein